MDLRDYLLLLRRGALTILVTTVLFGLGGVAYLQTTTPVYQTSSAVLAAPRDPDDIGSLQLGAAYAQSVGPTIAALVSTPAVLEPVAEDLRGRGYTDVTAGDLQRMVATSRAESSAVVTVTASAADPDLTATVANAVASTSSEQVPALLSRRTGRQEPLLRLQVVQEAVAPSAPVSPATRRVMTLFLAIGVALGLAITLVRQSLDSRLRRAEDVTRVSALPLLATLTGQPRSARGGLAVRDAPHSPTVDGYRVLRTNLGPFGTEQRRSVLVTSAAADPGAAEVPANLAWSLAQAGRKVLAVDLDLRDHPFDSLLGVSAAAGAADVLVGAADLDDVVVGTAQPGLSVLGAGTSVQAPSDLMSSAALAGLLARVESEFDDVIVHAPALLAYTDAAEVARWTTRVVVVVRAGRTREQVLTSALGVLANVGVVPLGLVMTGARGTVAANVRSRRRVSTSPPAGGDQAPAGSRRATSGRP